MATFDLLRPWRNVLGTILLLALTVNARAADSKSSVESLLTKETVGFLHIRVGEVWDSPGMAFYRKVLANFGADEIKAADGKFAPSISQIESLTVIAPSMRIETAMPDGFPTGESLLWVITTKKPIERNELIKALGLDAKIKAHRGADYLFEESHWAGLMQLDPNTIVIGAEDSIVNLIEQRENGRGAESALAKIFSREAGKHAATFAVNPVALATPDVAGNLPGPFAELLKASSAWATLDMKQQTQLSLTIDFADADRAAAGKKAIEAIREMTVQLIATGFKSL
jgi:hypothetical protein